MAQADRQTEKKMKIVSCILLAMLLFVPFGDLVASDLRCGSKLISIGDYKYDVLRKCGDPVNVETWEEMRIRRDLILSTPISPNQEILLRSPLAKEYVTIEEWQYNLGRNQFMRYLRFENGKLTKIVTGDYGY